jgi:hypothetical protein
MKNTNNAKKLTLNKETIRNLSDEKLGQVAGGDGDSGVCSVNACNSAALCQSAICSIIPILGMCTNGK